MYAIVDIETTGGFAAGNSIIEISIQVCDGEKIIERFESRIVQSFFELRLYP